MISMFLLNFLNENYEDDLVNALDANVRRK